jgi:hypothetical protein
MFTGQNSGPEVAFWEGEWNETWPTPVVTQIDYAVDVSPKEDLNQVIESDYNLTETNITIRVHVTDEDWNNTIWDMDVLLWNSTDGTQVPWPHWDFDPPLKFCEDYYFNVSFGSFPPEEVVLHFSNETGDNIGFAFSYPEGAKATLVGQVSFSMVASGPNWVRGLNVTFFDNATQNETGWSPMTATTNSTGWFNLSGIDPGTYDIGVKNWTSLSEMNWSVALTAGGTTVVTFDTPPEGDTDDNDHVAYADYINLLLNYDKVYWQANFDRSINGKVGYLDYIELLLNYDKKGDVRLY